MYRSLRFLVYSNVWVGIAVGCLTWLSRDHWSEDGYSYIAFTFFSTVASYNYMRMVLIPRDNTDASPHVLWMKKHMLQAVVFTFLFSLLAILCIWKIYDFHLILLLLPAVLISILYPLGFRNPFRSFTSLRNVPGLKVVLISASWAYVTQLLPEIHFEELDGNDVVEFFMRIILIAGLVIPFDIRDLRIDEQNIKTIPQLTGIRKAKNLAMLLIILYWFWKLICWMLGFESVAELVAWTVGLLLATILVKGIHIRKNELYTGFWIEATPVYVAIVLLLLHYFI